MWVILFFAKYCSIFFNKDLEDNPYLSFKKKNKYVGKIVKSQKLIWRFFFWTANDKPNVLKYK